MFMLKPTVLFYLKRHKPGNNSGPNCPRKLKFLHKNSGMGSTQYYEKNSGLSSLFQNAPIYAHVNVKTDCVILFQKTKPGTIWTGVIPGLVPF